MKPSDTHKLLPHLSAGAREKLERLLQERKFNPGQRVFEQDTAPEGIYFIVEGRAKIQRVTSEGHENLLCVRGPGEYFCPVSALDGKGQLGSAVAMTLLSVLWVKRSEFRNLAAEHREIVDAMNSACLAEVRHLLSRLESAVFDPVRDKVLNVLLSPGIGAGPTKLRDVWLTHQEIAGLCGSSRESVSRVLKQLESEGLVRLARGRVTLCDPERLARMLHS